MATLTTTNKLLTEKLVTAVDTITSFTKYLAAKANNGNTDGATKRTFTIAEPAGKGAPIAATIVRCQPRGTKKLQLGTKNWTEIQDLKKEGLGYTRH